MIIISQDKDKIVNYSNTNVIVAEDDGVIKAWFTGCNVILGKYENKERAKEIINNIQTAYSNITMINIPKIRIHEELPATEIIRNIAYKMPEK